MDAQKNHQGRTNDTKGFYFRELRLNIALREKCPNTEFFGRDTPYLSVFSSNTGKYGPEKTPYLDTFHAV